MRTILTALLASLMFICCTGAKKQSTTQVDTSTIYVYYFHGAQRCKTCIAVEQVAKEAVAQSYTTNERVKYVEVKTDDPANEALVAQYEVAWNALIIAKGDNSTNITEQAFASAVNTPQRLTEMIKAEVDKRLQ